MKIEKGVPIPNQIGGGKWKNIAVLMEVNDSVFFAGKDKRYTHLMKAMKNLGLKSVSRWVGDGYRVWRVE
mgnify:CR=1 FL=1